MKFPLKQGNSKNFIHFCGYKISSNKTIPNSKNCSSYFDQNRRKIKAEEFLEPD